MKKFLAKLPHHTKMAATFLTTVLVAMPARAVSRFTPTYQPPVTTLPGVNTTSVAPTGCQDSYYYPTDANPPELTELLAAQFGSKQLQSTLTAGFAASGTPTWGSRRIITTPLIVGPDISLTANLANFESFFSSGLIEIWFASETIYTGATLPDAKKLDPVFQYFRIFDTDTITSTDASVSKWRILVHRRTLLGKLKNELEIQLGGPQNTPIIVPIANWSPREWHKLTLGWDSTDVTNPRIEVYLDGRVVGHLDAVLFTPAVIAAIKTQNTKLYWINSKRGGDNWASKFQLQTDSLKFLSGSWQSVTAARSYAADVLVNSVSVQNQDLKIMLNGFQYGFGIGRILDTKSCDPKTGLTPGRGLWSIQLKHATQPGTTVTIRSNSASWGNLKHSIDPATGATQLVWPAIPLPEALITKPNSTPDQGGTLHAEVTITPKSSAPNQIEVRLSQVKILSSVWQLDRIQFLNLEGLGPVHHSAADTQLVLPDHAIGRTVPNPFGSQDSALKKFTIPGYQMLNPKLGVLQDVVTYSLKRATLPWSETFPGRSMSMQVFGLYSATDETSSLMIADPDPNFRAKKYSITQAVTNGQLTNGPFIDFNDSELDFSVSYLVTPAERAAGEFKQAYGTALSLFTGNWYQLGRTYRTLALERLADIKRLVDRDDFSKDMFSVGLRAMASSFTYETSPNTTDCMLIKNGLLSPSDAKLLLCEARSWHTDKESGQNAGNPFALPRPGVSAFANAINSSNQLVSFYNSAAECNNPSNKNWVDNCSPYRLWIPPPPPTYLPTQISIACPSSAGWSQTLSGYFSNFASTLKPQAMYLDVFGANSTHICTENNTAEHPHDAYDPTLYVKGARDEIKTIRQAMNTANPATKITLFTESFNEAYVGVIDGFLNADTDFENPVPLAIAAYHEQALFDGISVYESESCKQEDIIASLHDASKLPADPKMITPSQTQNYHQTQLAKIAWYFNWGGIPIHYDKSLLSNSGLFSQLMTYARWRKQLSNFLSAGEMLEPMTISQVSNTGQITSLPIDTFEAVTSYSSNGAFFLATEPVDPIRRNCYYGNLKVPRVLTSTWHSAVDSSIGVLLVSNSDSPTTVRGLFGSKASWNSSTLPTKTWTLTRMKADHTFTESAPTAFDSAGFESTISLAPREVVFVKLN